MNIVFPDNHLRAGLPDPVLDSQRVFRAALEAFSNPGRAVQVPVDVDAPAPLASATAAFVLSMADLETPVWLQEPNTAVAEYIRFHCGAPIVERHCAARFALVTDPAAMPALDLFDPGDPEYPDRSATIIIQRSGMKQGTTATLRGPGIEDALVCRLSGLEPDFWMQWQRNHARFPCGVDVLFTCGNVLHALPRTTRAEV